jgi:hypothetical protein
MIETLERTPDLNERIVTAYEEALERRGEAAPLAEVRRQAMDTFARLGIPTRKHEAWKYTNIERALRHDYALLTATPPPASPAPTQRASACPASTRTSWSSSTAPSRASSRTWTGCRRAWRSAPCSTRPTPTGRPSSTYFAKYASVDEDAFVA